MLVAACFITADDLPIALSKLSEVYCLTHFYETEKEDEEEVRYIGVYSTIDNVKAAIDLLKTKPGFESHPNDYNYDKFELNKTEWSEGFISWDEALDI